MKKRFSIMVILLVMIILSLTGCKKCVEKTDSMVKVKITNEFYEPENISYYTDHDGKIRRRWDSAEYEITVEYNDKLYSFRDSSTYRMYHGKVGKTVNAVLRTKKYDDGTIEQKIVKLEGVKLCGEIDLQL